MWETEDGRWEAIRSEYSALWDDAVKKNRELASQEEEKVLKTSNERLCACTGTRSG